MRSPVFQRGSSPLVIIGIFVVIILLGFGAWWFLTQQIKQEGANSTASLVDWSFDGNEWKPSGTPPACPEPLVLPSPVDIAQATAILYPGQTRGSDYKPHGGFLFGNTPSGAVTVKAPLDAVLLKGSRYIEQGEIQYLLIFVHPCGIMYRFDHLQTLSPPLQALANALPAARENNSATSPFPPESSVKAGDVVATVVGFPKLQNISLDFGVYDLRRKNSVSGDTSWRQIHPHQEEFGEYGVCWLDYLVEGDKAAALALPGGDGQAGKQSDYCKT